MDWPLAIAALAGVTGAAFGNRFAIPLLVSLGLCLACEHTGLALGWMELLSVDLMVMAVIIRRNMGLSELLILALFPVAWAGYAIGWPLTYTIGYWVVIVQLLLCLPVPKPQNINGAVSHGSIKGQIYEGT